MEDTSAAVFLPAASSGLDLEVLQLSGAPLGMREPAAGLTLFVCEGVNCYT